MFMFKIFISNRKNLKQLKLKHLFKNIKTILFIKMFQTNVLLNLMVVFCDFAIKIFEL